MGAQALLGEISYNDGMKIAILGAGASGLYSAILIQRLLPHAEITVFEKETKLGKKLYATGNGHCNVLNRSLLPEAYNDPSFISKALSVIPASVLMDTLRSWGVALREDGNLVYPLSYSAESYVHYLFSYATNLGVHFVSPFLAEDYEADHKGHYFLLKNHEKIGPFDALIIACGAKSAPRLGSDGSFLPALEKHGYHLIPFRPGLAPIKLQEDIHLLAGARHGALVKAFDATQQLFQEEGEVLFKKDGISGIVILNAESAIYRRNKVNSPRLEMDLFPHIEEKTLIRLLSKAKAENASHYLSSLVSEPFVRLLEERFPSGNPVTIAAHLKHLVYHVKGRYDFMDSQVSLGGVALNEVTNQLESRHEKRIYFAGEILNIDGFCGGYNLSWALLSALLIAENFKADKGRMTKII